MTEWKTIDSAPKNKGRIVALVDGEVRFVYWGKTSHVPLYGWNLADQGPENCELCEPTLWFDIPAPLTGGRDVSDKYEAIVTAQFFLRHHRMGRLCSLDQNPHRRNPRAVDEGRVM